MGLQVGREVLLLPPGLADRVSLLACLWSASRSVGGQSALYGHGWDASRQGQGLSESEKGWEGLGEEGLERHTWVCKPLLVSSPPQIGRAHV